MTIKSIRLRAPKGLSEEAKSLWNSVVSTWEMDGAAHVLLANCCRALDRAREVERILAKDGPTLKDRFGQLQQHPCVRTLAVEHGIFLRTLKQLGLDIEQIGQGRPGRPDGWQPS